MTRPWQLSKCYPNLVHSEYQYDSLNRLTNLNSSQLLTPIANYTYTVGPAGNRLTASEQLMASALNSQPKTISRLYTYDSIYRLTGETINEVPASGSVGYNYDPVGNRLARNSTLPTLLSQNFTFDANDRLNTDTRFLRTETSLPSRSSIRQHKHGRILCRFHQQT